MRFFTLDFAYPEAWAALPHSTPEEWFAQCFGTADFLDVALRAAGHEAMTLMVNGDPHWQAALTSYDPDVVISTNVGMWGAYEGSPLAEFRRFNPKLKLIGFCSYQANDQTLTGWDVLFSSFPWMPDYCKALGQRCEYLPLAFGAPVLERVKYDGPRDIPVSFIGGLGSRIWKQGTETMAAIAEAVPEFRWWGYKIEQLPPSLERTYQGQAWGQEYYKILMRSEIVLNRHGEIARGFGNNMRQYEAVGCGAHLVTDDAGELRPSQSSKACSIYESADEAIAHVRSFWEYKFANLHRSTMQEYVLKNHTFTNRAARMLELL